MGKVWLIGLAQGLRPKAKEGPRNVKNSSVPFSFGKAFLQHRTSQTRTFVHVDELEINNPYFGQSPVIADLDGDIKPDVVWLNMNGPLRAFLNQSGWNAISVVIPDNVQLLGTQVTVESPGSKSYTEQMVTRIGLMSDSITDPVFGPWRSDRS